MTIGADRCDVVVHPLLGRRGITQTPTVFVNRREIAGNEVSVPADFERAVARAATKPAGT